MLTQAEADALIAMRKEFLSPQTISLPPGADETCELLGEDKRERFLLDLWRSMLRLSKLMFQTRVRKVIVLVRLDIDGAPHTNPDGGRIGGMHIHVYREGFEDRWASPVDAKDFPDTTNIRGLFDDFCRFCNIQNPPPMQGTLI